VPDVRRLTSYSTGIAVRSDRLIGRQLLNAAESPSQQVTEEELAARVRHAIGNLPDNDREILLMRTYEGLTYDEISWVLEVETAAARTRYGRALIRLQKVLTRDGLSESQL
jgi:RNA polymerase sigma factor (sigma-70 family)